MAAGYYRQTQHSTEAPWSMNAIQTTNLLDRDEEFALRMELGVVKLHCVNVSTIVYDCLSFSLSFLIVFTALFSFINWHCSHFESFVFSLLTLCSILFKIYFCSLSLFGSVVTCSEAQVKDDKTTVQVSSNFVDGEATYSCAHGLELIGNMKRICLDNGEWSGQVPFCRCKLLLSHYYSLTSLQYLFIIPLFTFDHCHQSHLTIYL